MSAKLLNPIALLAVLLAPVPALAQTPAPAPAEQSQLGRRVLDDKAEAARVKRLAEAFERNARILTVFDRQGKVVTTVGPRAIYNLGSLFSPDGKRVAVAKFDQGNDTVDIWVLDVATGASTRITSSQPGERHGVPVWSPDGSQLAYMALRGSYERLYRKASNGEGAEQLLYEYPGAGMTVSDWSMDGRFLSFFTTNLSGSAVYVLPLGDEKERRPIEVFRSEFRVARPRFSPDGRFLSYVSELSGKNEVYVRPFDPSAGAEVPPLGGPWQISNPGNDDLIGRATAASWRGDGKEMYYFDLARGVMVVEVSTAPTFTFGKPTLLLHLPDTGDTPGAAIVSRDGQQVVVGVHPAPTRQQITVFDRQGKVLSKLGAAGRYRNPALSPDGKRVAVVQGDQFNPHIWTFDVASGRGTPVTTDSPRDSDPIWSPDGSQVAYVSTRGSFSSIYRKAWDGTGNEEQLFRYTPGASLWLTDWSADGKFLTFHDSCAGVLHVVPLSGDQNALGRKAIDWLRDEYSVAQARFSPDARFIAYLSDEIEAERFEVYVRPFDASKPEAGAGSAKPLQVSTAGALGMIFWRQDGKEVYFLTPEWEVMAVDVTTTPEFHAGIPRLLFKVPGPLVGNPQQWRNVSRDGERFVFAINVPVNPTAR